VCLTLAINIYTILCNCSLELNLVNVNIEYISFLLLNSEIICNKLEGS
jgi:hypothetical protein